MVTNVVAVESSPSPPSISFGQFIHLLDDVWGEISSGHTPERLDRVFWERHDFERSIASKLRSGLKLMSLLEGQDHRVTRELLSIANVNTRAGNLRDIVTKAYAQVLPLAYRSDVTRRQFEIKFKATYGLDNASTVHKAVTFLVSAADFTQLNLAQGLRPGVNNLVRIPALASLPSLSSMYPAAVEAARGDDAQPIKATKPTELVTQPDALARLLPHDVQERTVYLRSGGSVTVSFTVGWFDLDEDDRAFVLSLIDQVKTYRVTPEAQPEARHDET